MQVGAEVLQVKGGGDAAAGSAEGGTGRVLQVCMVVVGTALRVKRLKAVHPRRGLTLLRVLLLS